MNDKERFIWFITKLDKKMEESQEEAVEFLLDKPGTWRHLSVIGEIRIPYEIGPSMSLPCCASLLCSLHVIKTTFETYTAEQRCI